MISKDIRTDNEFVSDIIENATLKLDLKITDLCSWISSVIEEVHTKYNNAEHAIHIIFEIKQNDEKSLRPSHSSSCKSIFVLCDRLKIKQVLFDFFDHAIKFNKYHDILVCSIQYSGNNHNVIVSITGTGNRADRLLQSFMSRSSEKIHHEGLFLSAKIIEAHGGKILVQNQYNDENAIEDKGGVVLSFMLPVANDIN